METKTVEVQYDGLVVLKSGKKLRVKKGDRIEWLPDDGSCFLNGEKLAEPVDRIL